MWSIVDVKKRGRHALIKNYLRSTVSALASYLFLEFFRFITKSRENSLIEHVGFDFIDFKNPAQILSVIVIVIVGYFTVTVISGVLRIIVFNPIEAGCCLFFKNNVEKGKAKLGDILEGFSSYAHIFLTLLLRDAVCAIWILLAIIPGIVKAYSYLLVPFIVMDCPELTEIEVLRLSEQMMKGNKWRAFLLDMSFFGWYVLGVLSKDIVSILWANPYRSNAFAALYLELKARYNSAFGKIVTSSGRGSALNTPAACSQSCTDL